MLYYLDVTIEVQLLREDSLAQQLHVVELEPQLLQGLQVFRLVTVPNDDERGVAESRWALGDDFAACSRHYLRKLVGRRVDTGREPD